MIEKKIEDFSFDGACLQGRPEGEEACMAPRDLETRSDDVFLVSYPRTGTNWVENILVGLRNGVDVLSDAGLAHIMSMFPCLELLNTMAPADKLQSPRFMMTHMHMFSAPREIFTAKRKVVLVLRNPKAAAASFVKYYRNSPARAQFGTDGTDEFLTNYMNGEVYYGCWWDWTQRWVAHAQRNPGKVFIIHYEDLHDKFLEIAPRLAEFIGAPMRSLEDLLDLEGACSVGSMKTRYRKESAHMVHSGQSTSWAKEISPEWEEKFDQKTRETFSGEILDRFI